MAILSWPYSLSLCVRHHNSLSNCRRPTFPLLVFWVWQIDKSFLVWNVNSDYWTDKLGHFESTLWISQFYLSVSLYCTFYIYCVVTLFATRFYDAPNCTNSVHLCQKQMFACQPNHFWPGSSSRSINWPPGKEIQRTALTPLKPFPDVAGNKTEFSRVEVYIFNALFY